MRDFWVGVVGRGGTNTYPKKVPNFRLATSRETDISKNILPTNMDDGEETDGGKETVPTRVADREGHTSRSRAEARHS